MKDLKVAYDSVKLPKLTDQQRKELYYIIHEFNKPHKQGEFNLLNAYKMMAPFFSGPSSRDVVCIYLAAQGFSEPEIVTIYGAPGELTPELKKTMKQELHYFLYHGGFYNIDEMAKAYNTSILPIIQKGVEEMGL